MSETVESFVYIMTNPSFPTFVKIGKANDPEQRRIELSRATAVPHPFVIAAKRAVRHPYDVERRLHRLHRERRVNRGREFFEGDVALFVASLEAVEDEPLPRITMTRDMQEQARRHARGKPRFPMGPVRIGDEIQFVDFRDAANRNNGLWATIVEENGVRVENQPPDAPTEKFYAATRRLAGRSWRNAEKATPYWIAPDGNRLYEHWLVHSLRTVDDEG